MSAEYGAPSRAGHAKPPASRGRGFTLVELLVVISVIALLSAILLPVTARMRSNARRIRCVNSLDQLGKAINLYVDDHEQWYPCASCMPSTEPPNGLPRICDLLARYAGSEIFECLDDRPLDPAYGHGTYFEGEGSSYEWAELLNHRKAGRGLGHPFLKIEMIPILRDYEPFHGRSGTRVGINGLFFDNHVESL